MSVILRCDRCGEDRRQTSNVMPLARLTVDTPDVMLPSRYPSFETHELCEACCRLLADFLKKR